MKDDPDRILIAGGYKLEGFWLNPDFLINEINEKYNPGYLRPFEIEKYNLEKNFGFSGYLIHELIAQGNENIMLGVADYYFMKAEQLKRNKKLAKPYLEKSIELYTALENIAAIYLKSTFSDRKKGALEIISNF